MMHRLPISVSFLLAAGATASEVTSGDASALFLRGSSEGNEEVYVRLAENSVCFLTEGQRGARATRLPVGAAR